MVDQITLGASQRFSVLERNRISEARDQSANRLATGRKVNSTKDDARTYLLAKSLIDRSSNLLAAKSNIGRGIDTLVATQNGLGAVQQLAEQLKGIALTAQSADSSDLASLSQQFDTTRTQLNNLVGDTSFLGTNLLSNPPGTLNVNISDNPTDTFSVAGQATDATALGLGTAGTTYNNFATTADIDAAIAAADSAISTIQSREFSIVSNAAILNTREEFTQDLADTLESGAAKLVNADLNEEGARILSANVRDSLAIEGQRIAARSDAQIVELISNR